MDLQKSISTEGDEDGFCETEGETVGDMVGRFVGNSVGGSEGATEVVGVRVVASLDGMTEGVTEQKKDCIYQRCFRKQEEESLRTCQYMV